MRTVIRNKKPGLSCEWGKRSEKKQDKAPLNKTRLSKYKGNFFWRGVQAEKYKSGGCEWTGVDRQTLIGKHGESAKFHLRYFEISPQGYTSFEMHRHEHVVIGIRGRGICVVGKKKYKIGFLDTLYIKPNEPHQLRNPCSEPFGFFCIVNAKRDRPKIMKEVSNV